MAHDRGPFAGFFFHLHESVSALPSSMLIPWCSRHLPCWMFSSEWEVFSGGGGDPCFPLPCCNRVAGTPIRNKCVTNGRKKGLSKVVKPRNRRPGGPFLPPRNGSTDLSQAPRSRTGRLDARFHRGPWRGALHASASAARETLLSRRPPFLFIRRQPANPPRQIQTASYSVYTDAMGGSDGPSAALSPRRRRPRHGSTAPACT